MNAAGRGDVERGKQILIRLVIQRVSVAGWMKRRIDYLIRCDIMFKEKIYLQIEMEQLQAYMEMRFCY